MEIINKNLSNDISFYTLYNIYNKLMQSDEIKKYSVKHHVFNFNINNIIILVNLIEFLKLSKLNVNIYNNYLYILNSLEYDFINTQDYVLNIVQFLSEKEKLTMCMVNKHLNYTIINSHLCPLYYKINVEMVNNIFRSDDIQIEKFIETIHNDREVLFHKLFEILQLIQCTCEIIDFYHNKNMCKKCDCINWLTYAINIYNITKCLHNKEFILKKLCRHIVQKTIINKNILNLNNIIATTKIFLESYNKLVKY